MKQHKPEEINRATKAEKTIPAIDVSILMPVRNSERFVGTAIRSSLLAISTDSEILVYLDGSDDNTPAIVKKLSMQDQRIRVFESQKVGIVSALNFLRRAARGKYIARMDADDICLPWRFWLQKRQIKRSGADLIFSSTVNLHFNRIWFLAFEPTGNSHTWELRKSMVSKNSLAHPTMLALRETMRLLPAYEDSVAEDYLLWLRALRDGFSFFQSAIPSIIYRVHSGQSTAGKNFKHDLGRDARIARAKENLLRTWDN